MVPTKNEEALLKKNNFDHTTFQSLWFQLQCRQPSEFAEQRLHPTEAQIATLPHYTDPLLKLARTENQTSYGDPYVAPNFYHEEPNKVKKPRVQHLERSFIN